jgi:transposase
MERLYTCCCGLDAHKQTVVVCLLRPTPDGQSTRETRTFPTTTDSLLALSDWLRAAECTHVAIESTVLVVNAAHIKNVAGRKTDVSDAAWIADLLQHGLLRPSFIPDRAQRELRDLTRTRTSLVDERTAAVNRIQKVLEDANIKLAGVASGCPLGRSWAPRVATSSPRCSRVRRTPRRWRSWRAGSCGASGRHSLQRCAGG